MKINKNDVDKYGGESLANFFSLKDNGDKATVRMLYETDDDVDLYAVHQIKLPDGSFRYVDCLRESYDAPFDDCPLCARGRETKDFSEKKAIVKLWVPIYNVDEDEVQIWERGKAFYNKQLTPLMAKYGEPFCANVFEIERIGAAGYSKTKYDITFIENDKKVLDDFDEIDLPNPAETIILSKSFEELNNFVNTRTFDGSGTGDDMSEDEAPKRRESYNGGGMSERKSSRRPSML